MGSWAKRRTAWPRTTGAWSLIAALAASVGSAQAGDDFDLSRHSVPVDRIMSGGPPKDGIPAIETPRFVEASAASFLRDDDRVVGLARSGSAKAYPLRILNWHEVVNDTVGDLPVAVTYCPLTGSAVAFDRRVGGQTLSFGVSGRLYESNVLMYDHQSESLWSQLAAAAVTGDRMGAKLVDLPAVVTSWKAWKAAHSDTRVLSTSTGHARDYDRNPYDAYESSGSLMFRPSRRDRRLRAKDRVLGLVLGGSARAYPLFELERAGGSIEDELGGRKVTIAIEGGDAFATVGGNLVSATGMYWFAWAVFHPQTSVWRSSGPAADASAGRLGDVAILATKSYWTSLGGAFPTDPGSDPFSDRGGLFVVSGTLTNRSEQPVHHVVLRFELVDRGGNVVYREEGFNRSAEALVHVEDDPEPAKRRRSVTPIEPGATDAYRMIFIGDEIPPFDSPRVSVIAVE